MSRERKLDDGEIRGRVGVRTREQFNQLLAFKRATISGRDGYTMADLVRFAIELTWEHYYHHNSEFKAMVNGVTAPIKEEAGNG